MNRDLFEGSWRQLKGAIQKQWGKLTDDDFDQIRGNWNELVGRLQTRYGLSRDEAERQLRDYHHEPM
ncbi:MAG TPA: CsbD family protein [Armatimonadota bacterium]|nr:CsbD family protein [Armatimonadota bacterium]